MDFFSRVYAAVKKIPYGRVTSYGALATYVGSKGSARMVGWAMNASHRQPERIPAHRVVNRNGLLTGKMHFSTPGEMEDLLRSEGIPLQDGQIINFEKYFWDPAKELRRVRVSRYLLTPHPLKK